MAVETQSSTQLTSAQVQALDPRLITPFEITRSAEPSSSGSCSIKRVLDSRPQAGLAAPRS